MLPRELNERLRDDYSSEVQAGVDRWNRHIERVGLPFRLVLPHKGFSVRLRAIQLILPNPRTKTEWTIPLGATAESQGVAVVVESL
jgi:benzoyl-CoA 2,3-dioxygenase component B